MSKIFIIIILINSLVFSAFMLYPLSAYPTLSEPTKLTIPTYDGSGQCTHPSVVYIPAGFGGYKYWMAFTPYYHGCETIENPSLVASNDGLTWIVPAGITNPIVSAPSFPTHNSDPCLVYDGTKLILYYRESKSGTLDRIYLKTISSDMSISNAILILNQDLVSPAIVRISATEWILWGIVETNNKINRYVSKNGINWTFGGEVLSDALFEKAWHTSVYANATGYHWFLAAYPAMSNNGHTSLFYGNMGNPYENKLRIRALILSKGPTWTNREIYLSCYANGKLYMAAADIDSNWYIGYLPFNGS